ncbi:MAG: cytochrome-c peroxidase [Planctomycetes bacterium]|nr:cytochrome-c peroxidase [Planctomycetota bacterium]
MSKNRCLWMTGLCIAALACVILQSGCPQAESPGPGPVVPPPGMTTAPSADPAVEPAAEEPTDEPMVEAAEEPADEPMAEATEEPAEEPKAEEPADDPKAEEPKAEEPMAEAAEEPAEEPKAEEPAVAAEKPAAELPEVPLGLPPVPVPDDNPMTVEKVALGKLLYFDKRLSKDGTISCATCHAPEMAWTERKPTSTGIKGQVGGANSPTVINAAYGTTQFWDGRAASLEEQALGPIENPIEMGHELDAMIQELSEVSDYTDSFQKVFGTGVTREGIAKAIAAFERTVLSGNSPYDQFKAGKADALTDAQKHGMELFEELNCSTCHAPPVFSNYRFYNAGVGMDKDPPDAGRKAVTEKDSDLGKIRVPMLREVANTGPYFHDGSCASLAGAVAMMAGGGKDNPNLSAMLKALREQEVSQQDQKDLIEFLKALSGEFPRK